MPRTKLPLGILLILTISTSLIIINQNTTALAAEPTKLKISTGPPNLPADNKIYECIFIQLQDANSKPARALQDTTISLSSSRTTVGKVDPTVTITAGTTFTIAKFYSTFTPGTTTIAATSTGYATVQAKITTIAPVPTKLALHGFPPVLPADGNQYNAIIIELQDSSSNPAKAPLQGITVDLFSTNNTIASVQNFATINEGQTCAVAAVTSSAPGTATITAIASGYTTAQIKITTETPSTTPPKTLRMYSAPPKTMADNTESPQIIVQLLNSAGKITQPTAPVPIQLSSSNEKIGKIQTTIEIPTGRSHATATFTSTYLPGTTTITAAAQGITTATRTITTIGALPSKLAIYCNPSALPADKNANTAIQVQLQDSSGKPAIDPNGEVTVSLFSSEPKVGTAPTTLAIPAGFSHATATFTSTYLAGTTTITAQASGYTTSQATMRTYVIDQNPIGMTLTAEPATVISGNQTSITAYLTDQSETPVTAATVKYTSSNGGTFTAVKTLQDGYYNTIFTAPTFKTETPITITATATKTDYTTSSTTIQITVMPKTLPGTLQICIKNDNKEPVANALVTLLSQPSGATGTTANTNSTGYATFPKSLEGNYTVRVEKEGYLPTNTTFTYKTTSSPKTLYLTRIGGDQPSSDMIVWLIPVGVISAIIVIAVLLMLRRRARP